MLVCLTGLLAGWLAVHVTYAETSPELLNSGSGQTQPQPAISQCPHLAAVDT